ncbi:MAG: radical SAM protein [Proteobacteria bacterium]|nr:radical SAM protein [Pseudomonadota bacterium]
MEVKRNYVKVRLTDKRCLTVPHELAEAYGLKPGESFQLENRLDGLYIHPPVAHLARIYIEPTNICNLECKTCIRNGWTEHLGLMDSSTFTRIVDAARSFSPVPSVFFGGFGEPLSHPHIVDMIAMMKSIGARVELITNGTLLTKEMSHQLIKAGLDGLWVSIDGARPESYGDVRLGAALPNVISNIETFRDACFTDFWRFSHPEKPEIGIVFVAMKRNIADLPEVVRLSERLGAIKCLITNILPYSPEMSDEILYSGAVTGNISRFSNFQIRLPRIDTDNISSFLSTSAGDAHCISWAGSNTWEASNRCPFIERSATAINWEGNVSPCLPLMYNQTHFLNQRMHFSRKYIVGNAAERDFKELWGMQTYVALRERLQQFEFPPCTICGGCDLWENNEEDCYGNPFPTCGGCLWAQGIVQCP